MPSNDVLKNMIDNLEKNMSVMEENLCEKIEGYRQSSVQGHNAILASLTAMQKDIKESNGWKNKFMGALGVIFIVVVPIMSWALYQVVNLDSRIKTQLAEALEENFIVEPYEENN